MRALCLLSGPPGAGKTTVAEGVVASYERAVHLRADSFWHFIASGYVKPWLAESAEQNRVVMAAVAGAAARFGEGGYMVVVDGVVGPWFLEPFVGAAREHGLALQYVVLRPAEEVAVQRATTREGGDLTTEWPARKMYAVFTGLGTFERNVIDSSRMTADETAATVLKGISVGRYRINRAT